MLTLYLAKLSIIVTARRAIAFAVSLLGLGVVPTLAGSSELRLYVPRNVHATGDTLRLGTITIFRSSDADLAQKASGIAMGRVPLPSESVVIDRRTVLSRLATSGIPSGLVKITGATSVTVRRDERSVPGVEILRAAQKFLRKNRPGGKGASWRILKRPGDVMFRNPGGQWKLASELRPDAPEGHVKVRVAVMRGDKQFAGSDLLFKLIYLHRKPFARKNIRSGERITEKNTEVRTVERGVPPEEDFVSPYGMTSKIRLKQGTALRTNILEPAKPAIVVRRRQTVVMKVEGIGFSISGFAEALANGRPGDVIRVRNIDTRRIVNARVAFDGTVRPILER